MKVFLPTQRLSLTCFGCHADKAGDEKATPAATGRPCRRAQFTKTPRPTSFLKIGLVAALFICLVILSSVDKAESAENGDKSSPGENEIMVQEKPRRSRKINKILRTSQAKRVITEKRYIKSDWCKTRPVKQSVRVRKCRGVFINNFCYGQCNSFYIPSELTRKGKEQEAFKSCSFCKPYQVEKISVTLKCSKRRGGRGRTEKIMVNRVKECKCIAVPDIDSRTPAPLVVSSTSESSSSTHSSHRR